MSSTLHRLRAALGPGPVPWAAVAWLAVLVSFADGFVRVVVRQTVGAIERTQSPFAAWWHESALLLPLFALAVLVALAVARRRLGPELRSAGRVTIAGLLVAVATAAVATVALLLSAVVDYRLQTNTLHALHAGGHTAVSLADAQKQTMHVNLLAARYGAIASLGANVVLVAWVVALRGGSLGPTRRALTRRAAAVPAPVSVAPQPAGVAAGA